MDAKAMFLAERDQIVDTLRGLSAAQWEQPSLCEGWTVKDVVAHMTSGLETSVPTVLAKTIGARFSINRASFKVAKEYSASHEPEYMIDKLSVLCELGGFTKLIGFAKLAPDITVHHEDIRRPLGFEPHHVPEERMRASLSQLRKDTGPLKAKKHSEGIRFIATDCEWTEGTGPEVVGTGIDLLMAMAGRQVAYARVGGPGVELLRRRSAR